MSINGQKVQWKNYSPFMIFSIHCNIVTFHGRTLTIPRICTLVPVPETELWDHKKPIEKLKGFFNQRHEQSSQQQLLPSSTSATRSISRPETRLNGPCTDDISAAPLPFSSRSVTHGRAPHRHRRERETPVRLLGVPSTYGVGLNWEVGPRNIDMVLEGVRRRADPVSWRVCVARSHRGRYKIR